MKTGKSKRRIEKIRGDDTAEDSASPDAAEAPADHELTNADLDSASGGLNAPKSIGGIRVRSVDVAGDLLDAGSIGTPGKVPPGRGRG